MCCHALRFERCQLGGAAIAAIALGGLLLGTAGCRNPDPAAVAEVGPAVETTTVDDTNSIGTLAVALPRPSQPSGGRIEATPFASRKGREDGPLFEMLDPKQIGIDFFNEATILPGQERSTVTGSGVALGDYDGDGLVDVYLARTTDGGRLYRNLGNFKFEDVTEKVGIGGRGRWTSGATFVDINNDGHLDLYVCGYGCPNHLYINQGDGTFLERGREFGLDFTGSSVMIAFADFNRNGHLDAYLVANHFPPPEEIEYRLEFDSRGMPRVPHEYREYHRMLRLDDGSYGVVLAAQSDRLFRNNGDGTFTDVTDEAGISGFDHGLAATWWDYNNDGWPDLYVANDFFADDRLYRNNGDGTFTDVAAELVPNTPWFSMGVDIGDITGNGLFDLIGTDMAAMTDYRAKMTIGETFEYLWFLERPLPRQYMRNAVYLNTGVNRMMEVAFLTGLAATNWTWSVRLVDLDQDGRLDVHITNGMSSDVTNIDLKFEALKRGPLNSDAFNAFWEDLPQLAEANLAFRNRGELTFENVSREWGLDQSGVSFGAAFGDLDGDGDLDLVVNNLDDMVTVLRNTGTSGRAIIVQLVGTVSNRLGVGATVRARVGSQVYSQYLTLSRGFMSASDPTVHIGLGDAESIDELIVEWPSGHVQSFANLPVDHRFTITEPEGAPPQPGGAPPAPSTMFTRSDVIDELRHDEQPFDDFARQPLLPMRLSQLGPGMAVGDVTGGGHEDVFLGGAKGSWGSLMINQGDGEWSLLQDIFPPWSEDAASEDMGVLLLDANGNGHLDLFVVSGGVECEPGDESLRDRLYLNDGRGNFTRAPADWLPDLRDSGGVVAAADYNRDGRLDLFVGGRSVPGQYPAAPRSRLLKNDGGRFVDATEQDAPALGQSGLVTSALWTDVNGDGWLDLIVTHEWGPIKLFLNEQGRLRDATEEAGLAGLHGWWTAITGRDLNGNGHIDYVVTNLGRNTPYRVSAERPARLFYGDFRGDGRGVLLEGKYDEQGRLVPVQNKQAIEQVLPEVEVAFPSFHEYASATLADLVGQEALDGALEVSANTVDSVVLWNDGRGYFSVEPLPVMAQVAPGFGVVLSDFDGDGIADIYIAQNSYAPRREIGRLAGGLSVLLLGRGEGRFATVPPHRSGLVVPGDAKSVVVTDVNDDGWPDLIVGVNDGPVMTFEHQGHEDHRLVTVRLQGRPGNPTAIGARVTVQRDDGVSQSAEVYAGGGYLSQQSPALHFGLGSSAQIASIEVRWPDGETTRHSAEPDERSVVITQP